MSIRSRQKPESAIRLIAKDQESLAEIVQHMWSQIGAVAGDLLRLQNVLEEAEVVDRVSPDTITLNARAVLTDVGTGQRLTYTLVLPFHADVSEGRVSVLAPIGTAMLGRKAGESFQVKVPSASRTFRVERVVRVPEQPELGPRNALARTRNRAYPRT
jgi:regulator of nucleoside diphosphate kinase